MMYVEFIKKFFLADSRELMGVRIILASWAQKLFIHTFVTRCTSSSWKVFFSPIRANWRVLESFRPPEPKNVRLLLSRHDVRRIHEKFFVADSSELMGVRVISASWAKNVWFLLSRHDVGRFHEKVFVADSSELMGVKSYFGLLSPKTFDSHFLDTMYVEFIKNFCSLIRANWWVLESFRPPRHDVPRIYKKIFSRSFERTDGC